MLGRKDKLWTTAKKVIEKILRMAHKLLFAN